MHSDRAGRSGRQSAVRTARRYLRRRDLEEAMPPESATADKCPLHLSDSLRSPRWPYQVRASHWRTRPRMGGGKSRRPIAMWCLGNRLGSGAQLGQQVFEIFLAKIGSGKIGPAKAAGRGIADQAEIGDVLIGIFDDQLQQILKAAHHLGYGRAVK